MGLKMVFIYFGIFFMSLSSQADLEDIGFTLNESQIEDNLKSISFEAPKGHHFNKDSPNLVESSVGSSKKSTWVKAEKLEFDGVWLKARWNTKIDPCNIRAMLYVCDDKKTYCLPRAQTFTCENKKIVISKWDRSKESKTSESANKTVAHNKSFIDNDSQKALELAKQSGKPMMIDFYGVWCPPCNQLEENVFNSSEFKKIESQFVLLKLDADQSTSWNLKSKYKVRGYPTVIFASSDGSEVMRIVGAREKTVFISEMKKALNLKDQSFDKLKSKADNENNLSAAYSVGLTYLERGEYNEAQSYLLKASQKWAPRDSKRNKLLTAQIGVCNASANDKSATESQKKSCITIIETALAWFLRVVESLERHDQLASLAESVGDKEKKALTHQNALKLSAWFISNYKAMKNEEWTLADLHSYRASQFDGLDNKEEVEKEYHLAYEEFSKLIKKSGQNESTERGYNLDRLYCLWKSGQPEQAHKLYEKLQTIYSTDFSFFFQHARLLEDDKRYDEALVKALKALELSYGDNKLRVVAVVASIYEKKKNKSKALEILNDAISRTQLPTDKTIRTHRYYDKLVILKKKFEGSSN